MTKAAKRAAEKIADHLSEDDPLQCACIEMYCEHDLAKLAAIIDAEMGTVGSELPWLKPALSDWMIVGMNHYRVTDSVYLDIESNRLFVAMVKDGICIKAEGANQMAVWDDLERQAICAPAPRPKEKMMSTTEPRTCRQHCEHSLDYYRLNDDPRADENKKGPVCWHEDEDGFCGHRCIYEPVTPDAKRVCPEHCEHGLPWMKDGRCMYRADIDADFCFHRCVPPIAVEGEPEVKTGLDLHTFRPNEHGACRTCNKLASWPYHIIEGNQVADAGNDSAWPLRDILNTLIKWADHLRNSHDCDHEGYEVLLAAIDAARPYTLERQVADAPQQMDAAEICVEMARDAATTAARHASNFRESGDDIDANLKERHEAAAAALREAERRIRAAASRPTAEAKENPL